MTSPCLELDAFIADHVNTVQPLDKAASLAYWNFTTTGKEKYEQEYERLETAERKLYADRASYARLKELTAVEPQLDPLLSRQAKLLANEFLANQIDKTLIEKIVNLETGIEAQFNSFRAELDGRPIPDNTLREILRNSNDTTQCQAAWEASKQIGSQVAGQVRQVVQLRNTAARQVGFSSFYTMSLSLDELDEDALFQLWDRLDKLTAPIYADYKAKLEQKLAKRFGLDIHDLRPWHYGDPFFQDAPPAEIDLDPYFAQQDLVANAQSFYAAIGMDIADIITRSDLYEREGKQQHAYCTHIDRVGDVRVLCNVRPTEQWMATLLHEFGHAVYEKYLDDNLPWVLRKPAHISTTEAIAVLLGSLTKDPDWLSQYTSMPASKAQELGNLLHGQTRAELFIFTRWVLVMSHFERELYRNPNQDLNRLWWETVEHYQMIRPPAGRTDGDWAAKIHIATSPVYYHNYLLGFLMAEQIRAAIKQDMGNGQPFFKHPQIGQWLIEKVFEPGARCDWNGLMQHATGSDLLPDAFANALS